MLAHTDSIFQSILVPCSLIAVTDFFVFGFSFSFHGDVVGPLPAPSDLLYLLSWGAVLTIRI